MKVIITEIFKGAQKRVIEENFLIKRRKNSREEKKKKEKMAGCTTPSDPLAPSDVVMRRRKGENE